jgi:hypothetical protein
VSAAVGRVASAREVATVLERVEHRDEDARVDPHRLAQLPLAERTVVVQEAEELELPGAEAGGGMGCTQAAHRVLAEQRQEQAGARQLLREDAGLLATRSRRCPPRTRRASSA